MAELEFEINPPPDAVDVNSTPNTTVKRDGEGDINVRDVNVSGDANVDGRTNADSLRLDSTADLSVSSTTHAFQIGPDNGRNIGIDSNEIMARNAGANASLYLNNDGGKVYVGADGIFSIGGVETGGLFIGEQNVTEITTQSLDSLVTTGLYIQRASANTSATRKYPINVAGFLEVFSHNGNTNFVYQRYTAYGSFVKTYIRTLYNGTWYSWRGTSGSIVYSTYVSIKVSANKVSSANVSFPSGMFQSAPNVVVTPSTTAPGTVQEASASSVSASGCTVNIYRSTSTNTGVWVVAVETP